MVSRLRLQVISVASDIERRFNVLLVLKSGKEVTQTGEEEEHRHNNQGGCLNGQTQELNCTHQQVETTTRPVVIKVANEVGESVSQWAYAEQEWHLHEQYDQSLHEADDGEDNHQVEVEDIGYAERQTQDDGEKTNPLAVEGKIFLSEVLREPIEEVGRDGADREGHYYREGRTRGGSGTSYE